MKFLTTIAFAACFSASGLASHASAGWCFSFPFIGGWGPGYAAAPAYGGYGYGYGGGYTPFNRGLYTTGYRGYASYGASCCPSPCSSGNTECSTGCGSSNGGSSSCGAACSGTVTSDKVPGPVDDPGFPEGNGRHSQPDDDEVDEKPWRSRGNSDYEGRGRTHEDTHDPLPRGGQPDPLDDRDLGSPLDDPIDDRFNERFPPSGDDSLDDFNASDEPGGLFDERRRAPGDPDSLDFDTRKPDMSEPADDSEREIVVPPADSDESVQSRLYRGLLNEHQARTTPSETRSRFRLASQRRRQQQRTTRWSGRGHKQSRPLKWIGAPASGGRVRL